MWDGHRVPRIRGDQTWQAKAACAKAAEAAKDPDLFFPRVDADEQHIKLRKRICSSCVVKSSHAWRPLWNVLAMLAYGAV